MPKLYTPLDWYWLAADGRLFGSGRCGSVPAGDSAFAAWSEDGSRPSHWPRDEAGEQTDAALQAVLAPYGLHADLASYAAAKRYAVETGGIVVAGARIDTSEASQAKIGNAFALMQVSGAPSVEFKTQGGFVTLTADQFKTLAVAVGKHVQDCYAAEATVDAGITAGTIKVPADVDAAFAGLTI